MLLGGCDQVRAVMARARVPVNRRACSPAGSRKLPANHNAGKAYHICVKFREKVCVAA